jgi:hypothetical protein
MIASAAPVTSIAIVSATAVVASPVPSGVASIAGFCDSERTLKMRQDGVTEIEIEAHRTAHGDY